MRATEAARVRPVLALALGAWWAGFFSLMLLSFLLPALQQEFGLGEAELARLTAVAVGMTGVGGLLFGWMSDRVGRRPSLAAATGAFAAGNLLCALAPGPAALVAGRALAGLGIGGTWGAGQAMLGETVAPALRGRYGALAQSGAPLGLGLAAAVGSFLAPAIGWRSTWLLAALPGLALLAWRRLPESERWLRRRSEREVPERPILAQLASGEVGSLFLRAFVLTGLNMSAYWFAVVWLPRYLQRDRGLTVFGSGWWTLAFVAGSLTGYLTFGRISDRLGRRRAFTLYCALTALGLALVALAWNRFADRPGVLVACMLVAGVGTGTWSCYGPYFAELFPTRVRGSALSITMNVTRGVQFLAPIVIAAVAPRWGLAGGVALAAGFAALAAAWVWTLPETVGRELED
jgi:MFS family permease